MNQKKIYVFAVCGDAEHMDNLRVAIPSLRARTRKEIWVVTDERRNEVAVPHDHVIQLNTPEHFSHRQAAIYLKTALHRYLPKGNLYCYLDSDVVAIGNNPDGIFDHYVPPITFAKDHYPMFFFSPYAVNCGCLEEFTQDRLIFEREVEPEKRKIREEIHRRLQGLRKNPRRCAAFIWTRLFRRGSFVLDGEYRFDGYKNSWVLPGGSLFKEKYGFEYLARNRNYYGEFLACRAFLPRRIKGVLNICSHLQKQLLKEFGTDIKDPAWRNWNGGVFLFSDLSFDFMENWHRKCLKIFQNPEWKTRDQAALIATVWESGLRDHYTLSERFNFIADYRNPEFKWIKCLGSFSRNGKRWFRPEFVHVFDHFGDESWPVWEYIIRKALKKGR